MVEALRGDQLTDSASEQIEAAGISAQLSLGRAAIDLSECGTPSEECAAAYFGEPSLLLPTAVISNPQVAIELITDDVLACGTTCVRLANRHQVFNLSVMCRRPGQRLKRADFYKLGFSPNSETIGAKVQAFRAAQIKLGDLLDSLLGDLDITAITEYGSRATMEYEFHTGIQFIDRRAEFAEWAHAVQDAKDREEQRVLAETQRKLEAAAAARLAQEAAKEASKSEKAAQKDKVNTKPPHESTPEPRVKDPPKAGTTALGDLAKYGPTNRAPSWAEIKRQMRRRHSPSTKVAVWEPRQGKRS